ncbi:MAG: acyl carrier protein [Planctomycetes bacterium]|nr:acyl carrier protein [Planctomycetota bacterium]
MNNDEIKEKVIDVVCEHLNKSRDLVKEEAKFIEDLEADSLDIIELVMELEGEFDLSIPEADARKIVSVGDAIAYIQTALAG